MEIEKLVTAEKVAQILGISRSKAYAMMRLREIPTVRIGKSVRVVVEDLEGYIQKHRETDERVR